MAEDSLESTKISRRNFLVRGAKAAIGGAVLLGGVNVGVNVAAKSRGERPTKAVEPQPGDFGHDSSLRESKQTIFGAKEIDSKELLEIKKDWREERLLDKQADELATIWTKHWMMANGLYSGDKSGDEKRFKVNKILLLEQAKEVLKFTLELAKQLPLVRDRLAKIGRLTDLGEPPRQSGSFFGPVEFLNLTHSRLVGLNPATLISIGVIENTSSSNLYRRLLGFSDPTKKIDWDGLNWNAFNAHVALEAGKHITGQKDWSMVNYGPDSRGGVLVTDKTRQSHNISDRLLVMLQPPILAFRSYRSATDVKKVVDFEVTDRSGRVTDVGDRLLWRWNGKQIWHDRFTEMYKGLQEFCQKYPAYKWLLTESVV